MAFNVDGNDNTQANAQAEVKQPGSFTEEKAFKNNQTLGGDALGFGTRQLKLMSSVRGGELIANLTKVMEESFKNAKLDNLIKPNVEVFDNTIVTDLAYSAIVISSLYGDTVYYYTIVLEATGEKSFTASDIIAELTAASKAPGQQRPQIYTPDDANDVYLHDIIQNRLAQVYGVNKFKAVDGMVLNRESSDLATAPYHLAAIAIQAIYSEYALDSEKVKDLDIATAKKSTNGQLRFDTVFTNGRSVNEFGVPVRADWKINLALYKNNQQIQSINGQNSKVGVTSVTGFIDSTPEEVTLQNPNGFGTFTKFELRPNIIVTSIDPSNTSPCYLLLSLLSSVVMANPSMWVAALPTRDPKHQVGALNIFTNILPDETGKKGGTPDRIDLSAKSLSATQVHSIIRDMYRLDPSISIDIPSFGRETFFTSILSVAANPTNLNAAREASNELIAAAHWLTSGEFPLDFPTNKIFNNQGVIIPLGEWNDKNGVRDIRDIDLAFVASHTNDNNLINKFVLSGVPSNISGVDPFTARVDVISKLIPDAIINGKATRVTFTGEFIQTLSAAAIKAGLNVNYEPAIKFADNNNIGVLNGFLSNAGIGQSYGFAREFNQQGFVYNTNYVNAGFGRF